MKVALLRIMPQENWRSIEVYSERLLGALRAVAAEELELEEVQVQAWSWADRRWPTPYGRRASLRTLGLYLSRWVRYPLALRRVRADVYHILDNSYGHLAFFLPSRKTVVTLHLGPPRALRAWNPAGPAMALYTLAARGTLRAGRIIAVSDYTKQEWVATLGYPAERMQVVHHGVDPVFRPLAEAERARWREQLLKEKDRYLLLHVGHSAGRKNVEALYRALAILRRGGLAVRLLRIGRGPAPAQERLIAELGVGEAITHIPFIPNAELPPYYAAADAFVFPSLYEGFGIPLIEAMACGAPVVCTDWPLFREVCGEAALYADARRPEALAEAIARVLTIPSLAASLRAQGLARAAHFTWERAARETWAVYRRIAEEA